MQTPPDDLTADRLLTAVRRGWLPEAVTADYLPVGFGSHHWRVEDRSGTPWFASADAVDDDDALHRLAAAFGVAAEARAAGVVGAHGPLPSREGSTVLRLGAVRRGLDALDASGSGDAGRLVVTHGEPHPGNVVRTATGLVLVDWDTARRAEPERDLWLVAARADLDVVARYEDLTAGAVERSRLRARERRWGLADVASFVPDLLAAEHAGADTAWQLEALARTIDTL